MQRTTSQGQVKSSGAVAGLGAALVACAITIAVAGNSSPAAAPVQTTQPTNQCQSVPLMIEVSTISGGGTIRFREGSYLSPPIKLSTTPQTVVFPRARPSAWGIEEVITIEGNATNVLTVFPVSHFQRVYPTISGVLAMDTHWQPIKRC